MGVFMRPDSPWYWMFNELTKQKTRTDFLISEDGAPLVRAFYERIMAETAARQHELPMGLPEAAAAHLAEGLAEALRMDPAFRVALQRLVRTHTRRLAGRGKRGMGRSPIVAPAAARRA